MTAWWLAARVATAGIAVEGEPVAGQPVVVLVTDAEERPRRGETVRVVHRPGLAGEREVAVGITDGLGRVRWTPDLPGVGELRAGDEALRLRVGRQRVPTDTAVLLGLLGVAAGGAVAYGVVGPVRRRAR